MFESNWDYILKFDSRNFYKKFIKYRQFTKKQMKHFRQSIPIFEVHDSWKMIS